MEEGSKKVLRAGRTVGCDNASKCILSSVEVLGVSVRDTRKSGVDVVESRTN